MTCYLTIMVTILVATQIIRLIQNTIQLRRFNKHTDDEVMATWKELVNSVDKLSDVVFILVEENRRRLY